MQEVLAVAAFRGDVELAREALSAGADVNAPGRDKVCLILQGGLVLAASRVQEVADIVAGRVLQPAVTDGQATTHEQDGWTALHWSTYGNHVELVRLLLTNNANPLVRTKVCRPLAARRD